MSDLPPPQAEIEQHRLFHLNELAQKKTLFLDDGKCLYCGMRARVKNLCVVCEDRRQRLAEKYAGSPVHVAQVKLAGGPTRLADIQRPTFRNAHNSE